MIGDDPAHHKDRGPNPRRAPITVVFMRREEGWRFRAERLHLPLKTLSRIPPSRLCCSQRF